MSFLAYGAGTWTPSSATEHAIDCLNNINSVLASNNIQDASGNLIQFAASLGNVVWIMCLAIGNIQAINDQNLLLASQQFSIQQESSAQLLETLPMTGTQQIPGAYSLVVLQVTATSAGCTIPTTAKMPYGTVCNFYPKTATTIGPSASANILCQADTLGPIAVSAGVLTAFSTTIAGVASVTNPAGAILGRNQETIQQLQQRLLAGNVIQTNLGGTIAALEGIQGLTSAVVQLNISPTTSLVLSGGATIPPLSAYIIVEGSDITGSAIANAYATRMLINTWSVGTGNVTYTNSGISFASADNSINTTGPSFVTAGFVAGNWVQITDAAGSPLNNNVIGKIFSVAAAKMVLTNCTIATEAAGASDTLTVKNVQPYVTASGQLIPIQYDIATPQNVYVTVYYDANSVSSVNFTGSIALILTSMGWSIGQPVTSALILAALANFPYCRITGAQVSLDNTNWHNEVLPNGNSMPTILTGNITVAVG